MVLNTNSSIQDSFPAVSFLRKGLNRISPSQNIFIQLFDVTNAVYNPLCWIWSTNFTVHLIKLKVRAKLLKSVVCIFYFPLPFLLLLLKVCFTHSFFTSLENFFLLSFRVFFTPTTVCFINNLDSYQNIDIVKIKLRYCWC